MEQVAAEYKDAKKIIIIWDNLNIHKDGKDNRWIEFNKKHDNKFEFIYTPLHASWVNQVEVFFSILHKACLRYGNFKSTDDLKKTVLDFIQRWNNEIGHPFNWKFEGYPLTDGNKEAA
jgi:transposase